MQIKPAALDREGYIVDQRQTDNILFGMVPSSKNGCGWIACYNFLKALGRDPDPDALLHRLERTLAADGRLGLNVFSLIRELRRQDVPLNFALRSFHAQELAENCQAGIIMYFAGQRNHYAAFRREPDGNLRFYGAVYGRRNDDVSMAGFYWDHVRFPLALTITAKQPDA